nr:hypothetical protein [Candidatus Njordarchaeota archaeon]
MTVYYCFELHVNLWYAEYTDEEVIRRFPNLYRDILEVFERNPKSRCAFDFDASRTIPFLKRVAPDVVQRIKAGVDRHQFDILLDTWSLTLPPLLTRDEFLYQHGLALKELQRTFGEKGVSKGYLCQENSYSPTLPAIFREVGIEFLCTPYMTFSSSYETINFDKDRFVLIEGVGGAEIPALAIAVTAGWETTLQEALRLLKRTSPNEDVMLFVLFDAEMVQPDQLDKTIKGITSTEGLAFALPSEFVRSHKPGKTLKTTWETTTIGDFGLWVRDPADHYLLTLNEQTRHSIASARFWIDKAKEAGLDVREEERELNEAILYQLYAFNSDKMGWNPCWEKRKQGEAEYTSAMEKAIISRAMASEKFFGKKYPLEFPENPVKSYLVCNHTSLDMPKIPLRIPLKEPRIRVTLENLALVSEGVELPFEAVDFRTKKPDAKNKEEQQIVEAKMVFCEEVRSGAWKQVHVVAKPSSRTRNKQSVKVSPNGLSNGQLELKLTNGLPIELTRNDLGLTLKSTIGAPILRTEVNFRNVAIRDTESIVSSLVTNSGERGVFAELMTQTSQAHVALTTKYRIYADLPFLEVEKMVDVALTEVGTMKPLILDSGLSRPRLYERELNSLIASRQVREHGPDRSILVNDWFMVSDKEQRGIAVASEATLSTLKEVIDKGSGTIELANYQTYYPESKAERFRGTYVHRFYVMPTITEDNSKKKTSRKEDTHLLLSALARPPNIITMTQKDGARIQ